MLIDRHLVRTTKVPICEPVRMQILCLYRLLAITKSNANMISLQGHDVALILIGLVISSPITMSSPKCHLAITSTGLLIGNIRNFRGSCLGSYLLLLIRFYFSVYGTCTSPGANGLLVQGLCPFVLAEHRHEGQ